MNGMPSMLRTNEGWSANFGEFNDGSNIMQEPTTVSQPTTHDFSQVSPEAPCPVLEDLCDELDLWNVESEIGGDEASDISAILDADSPLNVGSDIAPFSQSFDLWLALRIVEDALALKFEWKGSEHGENLFRTLKVDPKAAGRGSLPPLSTATVLEPTPFTANGTT
ncbi:hypothetical protein OESDEN_01281 [Oesophagostomum dentatum]|uniref:Aftiphilin clathrin-binding box domain-containing protein n=1 Tax=Oesophagostomum dentatum TaxID=61180 RepID=A0A0B1TSC6_OESDE|nr:hypothetical protein OESDEN_01281 [Oesophagostomum dentatum]